jgi:phosphoglycerol transferase MdoB-like AlkP superfamily enzyme
MLNASPMQQKHGFLLEFHDWENWANIESDVAAAEKAGFRTFAATKDNAIMATVENHMKLYNAGIDVAYTYNLTNAVTARKSVNTLHRITPP